MHLSQLIYKPSRLLFKVNKIGVLLKTLLYQRYIYSYNLNI
jgi:hypothetical protein